MAKATADDGDHQFNLNDAVHFLTKKSDPFLNLIQTYGDARLPTDSQENQQFAAILQMFQDYVKRESVSRPLSIAVFGPPGSGKSFGVTQLTQMAGGIGTRKVINLSQVASPLELTSWLYSLVEDHEREKAKGQEPDVPLAFFDEFDTILDRDELGWLRWFLAPMWDGEFVHNGKTYKLKRAIFVFAGGTADRFEDFERSHAAYFRVRKGPDFVSRLAGFLNIEGLNTFGPERYLRRALVMQHLLGKRSESLKGKDGALNIEPEVAKLLLAGGHYIHGARSLEILIDMSTLSATDRFRAENLPRDELRKLHVSRGPLDDFTVGISAGQDPEKLDFFGRLTSSLIERGAALAYGGNTYEGDTLTSLVDVVKEFPEELIRRKDKRILNLLAYPSFLKKEYWDARTEEVSRVVAFSELQTLSESEIPRGASDQYFAPWSKTGKHSVDHHVAWSISLFRMRLHLVKQIQALVVLGGKISQPSGGAGGKPKAMPWGRFPGVAEEVMLALAFGVPIYVLGNSGGAAQAIGSLMGLAKIPSDPQQWLNKPADADYEALARKLEEKSGCFKIPLKPDLPETYEQLREFFMKQGPESSPWPYNGLTPGENRELFECRDSEQCVELVIRGITRLRSKQSQSLKSQLRD